jgi:serine/threonine-protein kinase RsbW
MNADIRTRNLDNGIQITMRSLPELAPEVLGFFETYLSKRIAGINPFAFKLALIEAISNAVRHGNHSNPDLLVKIGLALVDGVATFVVEDQGEGFDWKSVFERIRTIGEGDSDSESGRGICIMKAYGFSPEYNSKGNVLTLRWPLPVDTRCSR